MQIKKKNTPNKWITDDRSFVMYFIIIHQNVKKI